MLPSDADIVEVTRSVCESLIGLSPQLSPPLVSENHVTGGVHISGSWSGSIVVSCSEVFAKRTAAEMFGSTSDVVSMEEISDAIGEVANMIGGNLKAMFPPPCALSLPVVAVGHDFHMFIPGTDTVREVSFECGGERLVVVILTPRLAH